MKKLFLLLLIAISMIISCSINNESNIVNLKTAFLKTNINNKGAFNNFTDLKTAKDYLPRDSIAPVMSIRLNKIVFTPKSAKYIDSILTLNFEKDVIAKIKVEEKESHLTFELISITNNDSVDLIIWGPYPNTINKIISETVGVVRSDEFALGIQALNIKTLGGYPWNESDRMPAFDIFREDDPNNMHPKSDGSVLYRVEAAKPNAMGSSLQAYCRNRNKERVFQEFNHEKIVAPPYKDGGVIGSKIAIFGCPTEKTLETIGNIEIAEGLPHPLIDGEWIKTSPKASASYIIMNFNEDEIDKALEVTQKAGLNYLYYYGKTFESWGHFGLYKKQFPDGYAVMRKMVDKAKEKDIKLGIHILSNFITPNDAYVTPIPDKRLAKVGSSTIIEDIDETQTEILIESPEFFNQMKNNSLKTVMIGNELIRYGLVSEELPWKLLDCQRGAFKTKAEAHKTGVEIAKLLDHPYKVFLTNADLTIEISKTLAELFNETGLRQISFDGLEGNRSTGLGTYGESLMPYTWYNNLTDDIKSHLIIDASRTTHFFWHIYSRMNWGEPWYAGFRESQTEYRLKNQKYFRRNFMPGMLGWFKMTSETSIEDVEWLLARSAGFDAGFAFVTGFEELEKNGNSDKILELIGEWEKVRLAGLFTDEQKKVMENPETEFSLIKVNDNEWSLYQVESEKFKHEKKVKQPGEPLYSTFTFKNIGKEQAINFILNAIDADISDISMEIDNYKEIKLPFTLLKGQIVKYTGGNKAIVYDKSYKIVNEFEIIPSDFKVRSGEHSITIDCQFKNTGEKPSAKFEIRTFGKRENIIMN